MSRQEGQTLYKLWLLVCSGRSVEFHSVAGIVISDSIKSSLSLTRAYSQIRPSGLKRLYRRRCSDVPPNRPTFLSARVQAFVSCWFRCRTRTVVRTRSLRFFQSFKTAPVTKNYELGCCCLSKACEPHSFLECGTANVVSAWQTSLSTSFCYMPLNVFHSPNGPQRSVVSLPRSAHFVALPSANIDL